LGWGKKGVRRADWGNTTKASSPRGEAIKKTQTEGRKKEKPAARTGFASTGPKVNGAQKKVRRNDCRDLKGKGAGCL